MPKTGNINFTVPFDMIEGLPFRAAKKTSQGNPLRWFVSVGRTSLLGGSDLVVWELWESLSFSFKLKLGRLVIVIELKPTAAALEQQATGGS